MVEGFHSLAKPPLGRFRQTACLTFLLFISACSSLEPSPQRAPSTPTAPPIGERDIGAYIRGGVWQGFDAIDQVEAAIGHTFAINHWFTNWDNEWEDELVAAVLERGSVPLISWQNHAQPVERIAAGDYDAYIKSWAQGVERAGAEVYVRLFPEMNGDWVTWHGNPEALIAAWQRIATLFQMEGASNVRWVWSPNVTDWPRTEANRMENYYPGDAYVDVLALDGYNFGNTRDWSTWRSFEAIFEAPYERVSTIGPQPVWLAEVASAERGGDKGEWVSDMLSSRAFPRLKALVWFSEHKGADWRIESSAASLTAFRSWFSDEARDEPTTEAGLNLGP